MDDPLEQLDYSVGDLQGVSPRMARSQGQKGLDFSSKVLLQSGSQGDINFSPDGLGHQDDRDAQKNDAPCREARPPREGYAYTQEDDIGAAPQYIGDAVL